MAGSKLTGKIRASTLLEVVISMVIILVVFSTAMMIYANVTRSSLSLKQLQAQAFLEEVMRNAEIVNENSNQSLNMGDFKIEQVVSEYNDDKKLLEIDLTAYDANQLKIAELKKVILNKNE